MEGSCSHFSADCFCQWPGSVRLDSVSTAALATRSSSSRKYSLNFKRKPHQLVKLAWRHSVTVQSLTFIYLKTSFLVYNVLRERSTTLQSTSHKHSINSAPRLAISLGLPLPPHHRFLPLYQCRCYILYCLAKLGSTIALAPAPRTAPLVDWAVADASVSVQSHPP